MGRAAVALRLLPLLAAVAYGRLTPQCGSVWHGGAEALFDGVDDFLAGFPDFSVTADWTVEAWVQPLQSGANATQCIFHQSTYSGQNLFSLSMVRGRWTLHMGPNSWTAPAEFSVDFAVSQQSHVAVTYSAGLLRLFVDGDAALSIDENATAPIANEPALAFTIGACLSSVFDGLEFRDHLAAHVDEVRHWTAACTAADIQALRTTTGFASTWGAEKFQCTPRSGLTQYNFDGSSGPELLYDSAGLGRDGMIGGGANSQQSPTFQESVFTQLSGQAQFFEVLRLVDFEIELTTLLSCVNGDGWKIRRPPTAVGTRLTKAYSIFSLEPDVIVTDTTVLTVSAAVAGNHDAFEIAVCQGGNCRWVYGFAFKVLPNSRPTAGDSKSVRLFGQGGFVRLPEPISESGSIEFWVKMASALGDQTLFSVSRATGELLLSICATDGIMAASFCSTRVHFPSPQVLPSTSAHLAMTWEYNGQGYTIGVYLDCRLVGMLTLSDTCVRFGEESSASGILLPTIGQQYAMDGRGRLISKSFSDAYFDDIRLWRQPLAEVVICERQSQLLFIQSPALQAHFKAGPSARDGETAALMNRVPPGLPAILQCAYEHVACPNASAHIGFALTPTVFELPEPPSSVETTAGYISIDDDVLGVLSIDLPMFDQDELIGSSVSPDSLRARVTLLPEASCGRLLHDDDSPVSQNQNVPSPVRFQANTELGPDTPTLNDISCSTSFQYFAVDDLGLVSIQNATIDVHVKLPGPFIESVLIFSDGASDMIAINFNGPTAGLASWHDLFEVVSGSFGDAFFNATWSDNNDTLTLEVVDSANLNFIPDFTRLRCRASAGLRSVGGTSFPCASLSPPVTGSFSVPLCAYDIVYSMKLGRCAECGPGNFQTQTPTGLVCIECPIGQEQGLARQEECQPCPPGTFANTTGNAACNPARPGFYSTSAGSLRDYPCPAGSVAEAPGNVVCKRCPSGADCDTPQFFRSLAVPLKSHFRMVDGRVLDCGIPAACVGWDFALKWNRCEQGMDGYLCQSCSAGWWRANDRTQSLCQRCNWQKSVLPLAAGLCFSYFLAWVMGIASLDACFWGNMHVVLIRSFSTFLLATNVVSRVQEWELEKALGEDLSSFTSGVLNILFRSNGAVPAHLLGLQCWLGSAFSDQDAWWRTRMQVLFWLAMIPCWVGFLFAVVFFVFQCYTIGRLSHQEQTKDYVERAKFRKMVKVAKEELIKEDRLLYIWRKQAAFCRLKDRIRVLWVDSCPLFTTGYFLLAPTVLSELVVMLRCNKFPGGEWRLLAAPATVCWQGEHAPWFIAASVGVFVYCFLVPGLLVLWLYKKMTSHRVNGTVVIPKHANNIQVRVRFWLAIDGYEGGYAYWEGVVWLRRCLIVLVGAWPDLSRSGEFAFYQIIGIAALITHFRVKPFDNRMAELLDRIELIGLYLFLLLVTTMQLLLTDGDGAGGGRGGWGPLLLAGAAVSLALAAVPFEAGQHRLMLSRFAMGCVFFVLLVYYRAASSDQQKYVGFLVLAVVVVLCILFVLWLLLSLALQVREAFAEAFERSRSHAAVQARDEGIDDARALAAKTRNMMKDIAPATFLQKRTPLPIILNRGGVADVLKSWVIRRHQSSQGPLLRFDIAASELVLGLHPDNFLYDERLSAYTRRQLSKLAPFLSDQERRSVASSLKDAIVYMIVDCDNNVVYGCLLEFLVRLAFAWHFEEQIAAEAEDRPERQRKSGRSGTDSSSLRRAGSSGVASASSLQRDDSGALRRVTSAASTSFSEFGSVSVHELLMDPRVFEKGITAYDFQRHLENLTKLSKKQVDSLLHTFLANREGRKRQS